MRLIIEPNPDGVSNWVASYVVKRINAFQPTADRPFVLGAPNELFRQLDVWATFNLRAHAHG